VLAPKRWARGLSYTTGWLASASYFFWTAASCLITSQLIWSLVVVCNTTFVVQPWHYYLVYVCAAIVAFLINVPLFQVYPIFLKGLVVYINAGAIFILVALLARAHPKQTATFVFADFVNETGWSSNGVVFFLGLLPGTTAVNGFDSAAHMADEMTDPKRQVPQVMLGSALLSAISGLIMILVYEFCNTQPDNLLAPIGGQPISQLLLDCFDSKALTIIGILIFAICLLAASTTLLTTFSRIWWSFAKEGGVPFSESMSTISPSLNLPVVAICFCTLLVLLIGIIEIGSTLALNAILGTSIITIYLSYVIPIACSLAGGRKAMSSPHYLDLGKFGFVLNAIAVIWMLFAVVWLLFPLYLPTTGATMNYSIAVLGGVVIVSTVNWLVYSRKAFVFGAGGQAVAS
jgi:choline transport protein